MDDNVGVETLAASKSTEVRQHGGNIGRSRPTPGVDVAKRPKGLSLTTVCVKGI